MGRWCLLPPSLIAVAASRLGVRGHLICWLTPAATCCRHFVAVVADAWFHRIAEHGRAMGCGERPVFFERGNVFLRMEAGGGDSTAGAWLVPRCAAPRAVNGAREDGRAGADAFFEKARVADALFWAATRGTDSTPGAGCLGWSGSGTSDRVLVLAARCAASHPPLRRRLATGVAIRREAWSPGLPTPHSTLHYKE